MTSKGKNIMRNLRTIFAVSLLISFLSTNAQEVAPLQLGNIWIYDTGTTLVKVTVVDTNSVIDTIRYSKFINISNYGFISDGYSRLREDDFYASRIDTSYPAPNHELLYYKKDAIMGDTWTIPEPYYPSFDRVYKIEDTFVVNVFGEATTIKFMTIDSGLLFFEEYWTEKFGKLSMSDFGGTLELLKGCVIDGIAYGDTSFNPVSVEDEFFVKGYDLSQNFPNPFNPVTTISYVLPKSGLVTLKVFDILGKEVADLESEFKETGNYSVTFNASELPSGIYFYTLTSGNFMATKKLILLR